MDVPLTIHRRDGTSEKILPHLPHRYRGGGRVLQERRRPPLRVAQPRARGLSAGRKQTVMATTGLAGHIVAMARNNMWANHRLLGACQALTPAEFAAQRTGFLPPRAPR